MSKAKADSITNYLIANAKQLKYGSVTASLRIHNGRVVSINYETTECTKEREEIKE